MKWKTEVNPKRKEMENMTVISSLNHLMTPETTSKRVQAEIDALESHLGRLTELRDQYLKEEEAGKRKAS